MIIEPTPWFLRQVKRFSRKYPSITADIRALSHSLEEDPLQGTQLRRGCFKIRMAISSKNKGKSGGSRVITCVRTEHDTLYLLDIYDKSERDSISDEELDALLENINE